MKQYAVRFGTALVAAVLCVAGCSNPAQSETGLEGSAAVLLSLAGSGSRTLVPAGTLEYLILCTPSTGGPAVAEDYWDGSGVKTIPLSEGTWRISVEGRISIAEGPFTEVSAGSANITVRIGETVTKTIAMKPTQVFQGQGTFKHDAGNDCPVFGPGVEPAELALAELVLTKAATGALLHTIDLLDGSVPAEIELPAGYYTAAVTLVKNTGERAVKTAAVHIYETMTTALVREESSFFRFTDADFTAESFDDIAALQAYLRDAPPNDRDTPYKVKLRDFDLSTDLIGEPIRDTNAGTSPDYIFRDPLGALYTAFQGKFVSLDLSECTGNLPGIEQALTGAQPETGQLGTLDYTRPYRAMLTDVILPDTIEIIGRRAFMGCDNLKTVDLPPSVTLISGLAFAQCASLEIIDLSSFTSFTAIEPNTFVQCTSLREVILPASITSIGGYAFSGCTALETIVLPASVTSIGDRTFQNCASLERISLPAGITAIPFAAFYGCASLRSIDLPEGLTSIGSEAFAVCSSLEAIDLSRSSITSLPNSVFSGCASLETIALPASLTTLVQNTFSNCASLRSVDLSGCVALTNIGNGAFRNCASLESIALPDSLTALGTNAFNGCASLTSIDLPDGITAIGESTFAGCAALAAVDLPAALATIGNYAFDLCASLTSIDLPGSLRTLGNSVFRDCTSLTSIVLPEGLTTMGAGFIRCASLISVDLPTTLTSIGTSAFSGCAALETIISRRATPPTLGATGAFTGCTALSAIQVPAGSESAYQTAAVWSQKASLIAALP